MSTITLLPTGFEGFDQCMGGGVQDKSFNIIYGPPGTGKTSFCFTLMHYLLEKHYTNVFVNIDEEITDLKERYGDYKLSFTRNEKDKRLIFIDSFSALAELPKSPDPNAILAKPFAENLSFNILKALKEATEHKFIFIDSISSMLLQEDDSLVQKSLRQLYMKTKTLGLAVWIILIDGMHSQETLLSLKYMADNVFYMDMYDEHFIMKIEKTRGVKPKRKVLAFDITNEGVEFK